MSTDTTERAAFEAWYAEKWKTATNKTQSVAELAPYVESMRDGERYHDGDGGDVPYMNNLWEGWQARALAAEAKLAAQAAAVPVAHRSTGYVAPKGRYVPPVLFCPYTGEPRDARDIRSDPQGVLIVPPGADLVAFKGR